MSKIGFFFLILAFSFFNQSEVLLLAIDLIATIKEVRYRPHPIILPKLRSVLYDLKQEGISFQTEDQYLRFVYENLLVILEEKNPGLDDNMN